MHGPLEVRAGFSGDISFFYDNGHVVVRKNPERTDNNYFIYSWRATIGPKVSEGRAYIHAGENDILRDLALRERVARGLFKHLLGDKEGYLARPVILPKKIRKRIEMAA